MTTFWQLDLENRDLNIIACSMAKMESPDETCTD